MRRAATLLMKGIKVGEFYEDQNIFDVVVWGKPEVRVKYGCAADPDDRDLQQEDSFL